MTLIGTMCCAPSLRAQVSFPYPEIPASLDEPQMRMAYMLNHFWDHYSFADTTQANCKVGEQGIVDFINLLPHATDSVVSRRAVDDFVRKAFADAQGGEFFEQLVEHYLANPGSPLRNEDLYITFLHSLTNVLPHEDVRVERYSRQLRMLTMNRKDTPATDFPYITREGVQGSLYDISSPYTLLIFSDPDCTHCRATLPELIASAELQDSRLHVLLVYPDADVTRWQREPHTLPANWTDVRSPEGEVLHQPLYYLPSLPSLYLLNQDKCVLVKDGTLEEVVKYLNK